MVTWNLAQASPSAADCAFLLEDHSDAAVLVVGAQEVEDLKPRRSEGRRSRHLKRVLLASLGPVFEPVVMTSLGAIHLCVFVRKDVVRHLNRRSLLTWDVACGVGNVLQNKGALGVRLQVAGLRLLFLSGHLAAHQARIKDRNADYERIMRESELVLGGSFRGLDCIFFGGDLNYRLDLNREEVELAIPDSTPSETSETSDGIAELQGRLRSLLDQDQLSRVRASGEAFDGFAEGGISFPPTFKFDRHSDDYDTSKKRRVPAWTDRILYRALRTSVDLVSYGSVSSSRHSDHRPVSGKFRVKNPTALTPTN